MIQGTLDLYKRFQHSASNDYVACGLLVAHALLQREQKQEAHSSVLTVPEAALEMRISEKKVYQLVKAGDIPHCYIGTLIRIPRQGLADFLSAQTSSERLDTPHGSSTLRLKV